MIASTIALAAFSASAQMYGEIGGTAAKYQAQALGYPVESFPTAIRGIFGYEISPNLAIEAVAAFGVSADKVKFSGVTIPGANFKVNNLYGIYAKPKYQFTPEFEGFIRAGFAYSKGTLSIGAQNASASENSFSYGLGVSYAVTKATSINADYMSYLDKNNSTATGYTFGIGYKF